MNNKHIVATGLADRLTLEEAADLVAKETGKSRDYVVSYLTDCAEQGYFAAIVVLPSDVGNVSHIERLDLVKSTISTAELIEWLDIEIEGAHQRAREVIAAKETEKWGYPIQPEEVRVHLLPRLEQLNRISQNETVSMSVRNWIEFLADEIAERQQWGKEEGEAKLPVVRAEFLNLFVHLSDTLPLRQEMTGTRWEGTSLPQDWLTALLVSKTDLRVWAATHAPEISSSQLLVVSGASQLQRADGNAPSEESTVSVPSKPLSRERYWEQEILRVLRELGYDPEALPKQPNGKRGVRAAVRDKLRDPAWTDSIFEKAWQRLRDGSAIKDA